MRQMEVPFGSVGVGFQGLIGRPDGERECCAKAVGRTHKVAQVQGFRHPFGADCEVAAREGWPIGLRHSWVLSHSNPCLLFTILAAIAALAAPTIREIECGEDAPVRYDQTARVSSTMHQYNIQTGCIRGTIRP